MLSPRAPDRSAGGRRVRAALCVPILVAAGLGVRAATSGALSSAAGDILYATLVYTLVVVAVPRWRSTTAAATGLALCWLVELSQLTGAPAALAEAWWPSRYVLGTSFVWTDLLLYTVGVALGLSVDRTVARVGLPVPAVALHRDTPHGEVHPTSGHDGAGVTGD